MSYVYIQSEPRLWTVGFYKPDGEWEPDSDHSSKEDAGARVHYLNGGSESENPFIMHGDELDKATKARR